MRTRMSRPAFTLIELLVVIAIIAILIGLLVPAVQKVRAAAARLQCQNNLHQLGLAMHGYLNANKTLPPNGIYTYNGSAVVQTSPWSALARILPYIEQENLHRAIDFSTSYSTQPAISSKRIATFICPSDMNDRGSGADPIYGNKHWTLHYAVNLGSWSVLRKQANGMQGGDGAFSPNYGFGPAHFTDGMSNTIGLAEVKGYTHRMSGMPKSVVYPTLMPPPSSPAALTASPPFGLTGLALAPFDPARLTHAEWVDGKVHETGFTTAFGPNTVVPYLSGGVTYDVDFVSAPETSLGDTYAAVTSRSGHERGANVLFMDGSVHFISNGVGLETWRALGTRAGGDLVGDY